MGIERIVAKAVATHDGIVWDSTCGIWTDEVHPGHLVRVRPRDLTNYEVEGGMSIQETLMSIVEQLEKESQELERSLQPLTEVLLMDTSPVVENMALPPTLIQARLEQCVAGIQRSRTVVVRLNDAVGTGTRVGE